MTEEVKKVSTETKEVSNEANDLISRISIIDHHQQRLSGLKEAYEDEKLDKVLAFDEQLLKAEFDAYNHKAKILEPIFKQRSEFTKTISSFWLKAMTNDSEVNPFIDPIDRDALSHLEDLVVEHDPKDARNVTFHFHFSKSNPYFSNRVLTKTYKVSDLDQSNSSSSNGNGELKTESRIIEMNKKYDLDLPLVSEKVKIDWTSKDHDLVSKKPWLDDESLEDTDGAENGFDGEFGSFFNIFGCESDKWGIPGILLELHSKALDLYAGLTISNDDEYPSEDEDEDDSEEEDDDPNAVVELGSEGTDEPKKKKVKTSA